MHRIEVTGEPGTQVKFIPTSKGLLVVVELPGNSGAVCRMVFPIESLRAATALVDDEMLKNATEDQPTSGPRLGWDFWRR